MDTSKRNLRQKWAEVSFEKKVSMFVAPIVVFVVTGVLIPRLLGDDDDKPSGPTRLEQLEVVDVGVVNDPGHDTSSGARRTASAEASWSTFSAGAPDAARRVSRSRTRNRPRPVGRGGGRCP
jgi:hypothetical protein